MSSRDCQSDGLQRRQGSTDQRGCGEESQVCGQVSAPPEAGNLS